MTSIELKDAAKYFGKAVPDALERGARAGLLSAALRLKQDIVSVHIPNVRPFPPVARGTYRAGWNVRETHDGVELYNDAPHAGIVEHGVAAGSVKPGRAMLASLTEWVAMKGLADGAGATRVAFAIARNMMQTGIFANGRGLKILARAWQDAPRYIRDEINREIDNELRRL